MGLYEWERAQNPPISYRYRRVSDDEHIAAVRGDKIEEMVIPKLYQIADHGERIAERLLAINRLSWRFGLTRPTHIFDTP